MQTVNQAQGGANAPYSIEAEQQLLGALLSDNSLWPKVVDLVTPDVFFEPVHGRIVRQMIDMIDGGRVASPITLRPSMDLDEGLKELGGPTYLMRLVGHAVATFAIRDYALMLADLAAKRSLQTAMRDAWAQIQDGKTDAHVIAEIVADKAGSVAAKSSTKPITQTHLRAVTDAVVAINQAYMQDAPLGVPTGLRQLDRQLSGGFRPGQFILIGGRPGMGKTTLAQSIAFHLARQGRGIFYGSLEMTASENATRLLARGLADQGMRVPYSRMLEGRLSEQEMRATVDEAKRQEAMPLIVAERDVRRLSRFRASVRRAKQQLEDMKRPLEAVFVDYLQLLQTDEHAGTYDRVSAASDTCKSLAMELHVPVIALAQLSRRVEERDPPIPSLSDLRESGKLEEDADVVMFTFRDAYYIQRKIDAIGKGVNIKENESDLRADFDAVKDRLDLIIDKQRSGPPGTVSLYCDMAVSHVYADRSQSEEYLL